MERSLNQHRPYRISSKKNSIVQFSVYYISKVDKAELEKEILGVSEIEAANAVQVDNGSLAEMVREASSSVPAAEPVAQHGSRQTGSGFRFWTRST